MARVRARRNSGAAAIAATVGTALLQLSIILSQIDQTCCMSANPLPFNVQQPDGTIITLQLMGNEYRNYLIDKSTGYVVLESNTPSVNGTTQAQYTYAMVSDTATGALASSGVPVGSINLPAAQQQMSNTTGGPALASSNIQLPFVTNVAPSVGWTQLGLEHAQVQATVAANSSNTTSSNYTTITTTDGVHVRRRTAATGSIVGLVVMIRYALVCIHET